MCFLLGLPPNRVTGMSKPKHAIILESWVGVESTFYYFTTSLFCGQIGSPFFSRVDSFFLNRREVGFVSSKRGANTLVSSVPQWQTFLFGYHLSRDSSSLQTWSHLAGNFAFMAVGLQTQVPASTKLDRWYLPQTLFHLSSGRTRSYLPGLFMDQGLLEWDMIRYDTEVSSFNDLCWQLTHFLFFAPTSVLRMRQMDQKHGFNGELRWRMATVDGPKGIRRVKFERTSRRLLHKFLHSRVCSASLLLIVWLLNRMQPFERNLTAKDSIWVLSKENPTWLLSVSWTKKWLGMKSDWRTIKYQRIPIARCGHSSRELEAWHCFLLEHGPFAGCAAQIRALWKIRTLGWRVAVSEKFHSLLARWGLFRCSLKPDPAVAEVRIGEGGAIGNGATLGVSYWTVDGRNPAQIGR